MHRLISPNQFARISVFVVCVSLAFTYPASVPQSSSAKGGAQRGKATARAKPAATELKQARELLKKGRDLLRRNREGQALVMLETALRMFVQADDAEGEAATLDARGDLYVRSGRYDAAVRDYQSSQNTLRAIGEMVGGSLVLAKLGETYALMGKPREARSAFSQMGTQCRSCAASVMAKAPSVASKADDAFKSKGMAEDEQRLFDLVNAERTSKGLKPLIQDGQVTLMARNHSENMAREGFFAHIDPKRRNTPDRAHAFGIYKNDGLGENLWNDEGYKNDDPAGTAVEMWINHDTHADKIFDSRFTRAGVGAAISADGRLYFTEIFLKTADASCPDDVRQDDLYRAFLSCAAGEFGSGRVAFGDGRFEDAKHRFETVLAASDPDSPFGKFAEPSRYRVAALTSLGDIAFSKDDFDEALRLYSEALRVADARKRPDLTWAAQRGIGRTFRSLAAREKDLSKASSLRDKAFTAYEGAVNTIGRLLLGSVRSEESRNTFLVPTQTVFEEAVNALAETVLTNASRPSAPLEGRALAYATRALQTAEAGRARSLLDVLADAGAEIDEGVPVALLKRRADNRARQSEVAQLIGGATRGSALSLDSAAALEAEADKLESQYATIEEEARVASPRYAALTRPQTLTLDALQQTVVDDETALLEYSLGEESSYLWAVTRGAAKLIRLPPRAAIAKEALDFRAMLLPSQLRRPMLSDEAADAKAARGLGVSQAASGNALADAKTFVASSHRLYKTLVEPASSIIRGKQLIIVADGPLHYIPFETLVADDAGSDYGSLAYLIKTNDMTYAPSVSALTATKRQAHNADGIRKALVLGDPVFDVTDARVKPAAGALKHPATMNRSLRFQSALDDSNESVAAAFKLVRLVGTRAEAETITKLATSSKGAATLILDLDASETNLSRQDMASFDVLHLATHGILDAKRPQFSGLALSLVGDEDNDGFLRVDEVFNLHLNASLVMLSACETGLGELKRGDGVSGLARAFMYAGGSTVGVSLWSVSDEATAVLMSGFYKRRFSNAKSSPSASLRAAQLEMIAGGRFGAPFYWAPFILVGEWR